MQPRFEHPPSLGVTGCLSYLVALGPPLYCVYAWLAGRPLAFAQHNASVALHASLLASALLLMFATSLSDSALMAPPDERLLGAVSAGQQWRADWWAMVLLSPPLVLGTAALVHAAFSTLRDPAWGESVSGLSGLGTWLLLALTLMATSPVLGGHRVWVGPNGIRCSETSFVAWRAVESYVVQRSTLWLYLRGHGGVPYAALPLGAEALADVRGELDARHIAERLQHPRAFALHRALVACCAALLLAGGVWLVYGVGRDSRVVVVLLLVVGVFLTLAFERPRALAAAEVVRPSIETEDEKWARTRVELRETLEAWRAGQLTREQAHAWARELLRTHGRPDALVKSESRHLTSEILAVLAEGEEGALEYRDLETLLSMLQLPPGEEVEALVGVHAGPEGPAVDRAVLADILARWSSGELTLEEADGALLEFAAAVLLTDFEDHDPRSIGNAVVMRMFPLATRDALPTDVPACLRFLSAEEGDELRAWRAWTDYWSRLDPFSRREQLALRSSSAQSDPVRFPRPAALIRLLQRWQGGREREEGVQERAARFLARVETRWCHPDQSFAVPVEIAWRLANLSTELITTDDVPVLLGCLERAEHDPRGALAELLGYLRAIDYRARVDMLRGDPAYGTHEARRELARRDYPEDAAEAVDEQAP